MVSSMVQLRTCDGWNNVGSAQRVEEPNKLFCPALFINARESVQVSVGKFICCCIWNTNKSYVSTYGCIAVGDSDRCILDVIGSTSGQLPIGLLKSPFGDT